MLNKFWEKIFGKIAVKEDFRPLHIVKKYIVTLESDEDIIPDAISSDDLNALSQPETEEYLKMVQRIRSSAFEDLFIPVDEDTLQEYDNTLNNIQK